MSDPLADAEGIARRFHEAYERLAPSFGYKTQEASAVPWDDVPDANKDLMVAVAAVILAHQRAHLVAVLDAEEARWHYGRAPASEVIDSIRSALGVVEPVAKEAEGGR